MFRVAHRKMTKKINKKCGDHGKAAVVKSPEKVIRSCSIFQTLMKIFEYLPSVKENIEMKCLCNNIF